MTQTMMALASSLFIALILILGAAQAFYDSSEYVQVLKSESEFDAVVKNDATAMVQFYDPSDGGSVAQSQIYSQISVLMRGIVRIAAVDVTTVDGITLAERYHVTGKGLVTLVFGHDKEHPAEYKGPDMFSEPQSMVQVLLDTIMKTLEFRSTGKVKDDSKRKSSSSKNKQKRKGSSGSKVVKLNMSNYDEQVLKNPMVSMVAFIAPWCGHCHKLLPEWEEAAAMLDGEGVQLGVVDATADEQLAGIYGVRGYPTIKVFPGGTSKSHSDATDYQGPREAPGIVKYALAEVDRSGVPKEIPELLSHDMLDSTCQGHNRICVVAALPHILDSGAAGRNKYRDSLAAVAKSFRGSAFQFLWFEGTQQPGFEQAVELTFGYPAVVALSLDRNAYAVLHGSYSEKSITSFLHSITTGRQPTTKLQGDLPRVVTVDPWDGLDGVLPEEEMDLADIMGWDEEDEL